MNRWGLLILWLIGGLLLYGGYRPTNSQPEPEPDDAWQERLDRLEEKLDLFWQEPPTPRPSRPPTRRRPARRPPPTPHPSGLFVPLGPPDPPPTVEPTPPPPDPTPLHRPRGWTWAEVDAWRAFRDLAQD